MIDEAEQQQVGDHPCEQGGDRRRQRNQFDLLSSRLDFFVDISIVFNALNLRLRSISCHFSVPLRPISRAVGRYFRANGAFRRLWAVALQAESVLPPPLVMGSSGEADALRIYYSRLFTAAGSITSNP